MLVELQEDAEGNVQGNIKGGGFSINEHMEIYHYRL